MTADRYTKAVLTAIAVLLGILALRPFVTPRAAQAGDALIPYHVLHFDPSVSQIQVPDGSASIPGRIAIDLRTGNVYGFPTDVLGYPRAYGKDKPAISNPVPLGRFNLDQIQTR